MTNERQIAQITEMVEQWQKHLDLRGWRINIEFPHTPHPDNDGCEAEINDDLKYHLADLTIYSDFFKKDKRHQEQIIAHEMTHILLCRLHPFLASAGDDALEEVTQTISMLLYQIHNPHP